MRWTPGGRSSDLEDRRGQSRGLGMGGRPVRMGLGGALVLLVLSLIFHQDFFSLLAGGVDSGAVPAADGSAQPVQASPEEENLVDFVSFVLDDDQGMWDQLLPKTFGVQYQHAKLVLYRDVTQTGCGVGQSATGPFYCPADQKLYVDLSFYDELRQKFGAPGDFAQAYVLAHEIGHNVQAILGTDAKVNAASRRNPSQANALSVRMELQADCYAGVWGHSAAQRNKLDPGDVQEGLAAAAAVGDDRLQRMSTGRVDADSFTHGTSEQRMQWFNRGFESGDPRSCDTFGAAG